MGFHELQERARLYAARLRVENPTFPITPRFYTTQIILLILALFALLYGHMFKIGGQSQSFSLLISFVTWVAALVIVLGNNSLQHLKVLLVQLVAILLTALFFIVSGVTYSLFQVVANVLPSIKIAWVSGTALLGIAVIWLLITAFRRPENEDADYPGRLTAPVLFILLLLNYIWWNWAEVVSWIK